MERVMRHLVTTYRIDAVQMHDMDFFISEARTAEFCARIAGLGLRWWALGRADTLMQYSDATWTKMARAGLTICGPRSLSPGHRRGMRMRLSISTVSSACIRRSRR